MKKLIYSLLLVMLMVTIGHKNALAQEDKLSDFRSMERPPTYPGGISKFYELLGNNVRYPKEAVKNKIEATVQVSFVIEKDGSVAEVKVNNKVGYGLDEEAIRVIKLTKKWEPGIIDGKPVRVQYSIPIKFAFQ